MDVQKLLILEALKLISSMKGKNMDLKEDKQIISVNLNFKNVLCKITFLIWFYGNKPFSIVKLNFTSILKSFHKFNYLFSTFTCITYVL
jgi:hypothetical protein